MTGHTRLIAAVMFAGVAMTALTLAQGGAPGPQGQAPAPPTAGRGAGSGAAGPAAGGQGGRAGGGRRGGFTQFTRELAPQDVLVRGKSLYEATCASCHSPDLRGTATGPNLLRSGVALSDQHGDLVGPAVAKHTPALTLVPTDVVAIAEYLHSIHATAGGQGSPPGRAGVELNVLVGDAKAGETLFTAACSKCHSLSGDLKGIGSKYQDARALQNAWVAGSGGRFGGGGGRGGGNGAGNPVTVTLANGSKLDGTLLRQDDFLIVMTLTDGTRRSMARTPAMKVEVKDPNEAHKKMVLELDDSENRKMHDVTAYLWSVK